MKYKQLTKELQVQIEQRDTEIVKLRAELESLKQTQKEEVSVKLKGIYTLKDRMGFFEISRTYDGRFDALSRCGKGYLIEHDLSVDPDGRIFDILNNRRVDMTDRFEIVSLNLPEGDQTAV